MPGTEAWKAAFANIESLSLCPSVYPSVHPGGVGWVLAVRAKEMVCRETGVKKVEVWGVRPLFGGLGAGDLARGLVGEARVGLGVQTSAPPEARVLTVVVGHLPAATASLGPSVGTSLVSFLVS